MGQFWRYVEIVAASISGVYFYSKNDNDYSKRRVDNAFASIFAVDVLVNLLIPSAEERILSEYNDSHELSSSFLINPFENKSIEYQLTLSF